MARSVWLRFPRVFGGPALAERHAVTHEVSAIFKLRVLETPQARVDILPCTLERGREHRRVARGFRCSTGSMGPDYERSVPKKADPAEDGARHNHIDDRLHKRIRRCCHEFGELRVYLVPGAIDKHLHDRLWDTTLRQRSVMLAAVAVDQQRAEFVLIRCDIPNPVEASPSRCRVRASTGNKIG